jgi:hypothetical protein
VTGTGDTANDDLFQARVALMRARDAERRGRRNLWLAHHWPEDYGERCVVLRGRPVCRRCASLYPLGFLMALLALVVGPPWSPAWDPWPVWILSVPATVAYVGESLGWFRYSARWQVFTTLLAAVAFGRALGAELADPGQSIFWGPIVVFGGIWFAATVAAHRRRAAVTHAD